MVCKKYSGFECKLKVESLYLQSEIVFPVFDPAAILLIGELLCSYFEVISFWEIVADIPTTISELESLKKDFSAFSYEFTKLLNCTADFVFLGFRPSSLFIKNCIYPLGIWRQCLHESCSWHLKDYFEIGISWKGFLYI